MSIKEISRDVVRDYLVKVKLFRIFIYVFVALGFLIFAFYYVGLMGADAKKALSTPITVAVLIGAFIPSMAFRWYVSSLEKKLRIMMKKLEEVENMSKPSEVSE